MEDIMRPFDSKTYRRNTKWHEPEGACCLCGKETLGIDGAIHVPINHETGEFVTKAQSEAMGDAVSLYPIGPECAKKWAKEYDAESCRFRRTRGKVIAYDRQETR